MAIKNVIDGNFVVDDYNNTTDRVDESSDEDVEDTFNKIRKSLVQNYTNNGEETNNSLKYNSLDIQENSDNKEDIKTKKLNKRKFFLGDNDSNDSKDEETPIKKKIPLDDSGEDDSYNDTNNIHVDTENILEDNKEEDSDIDDNIVSIKKKKMVLEDSEDEDVDNINETSILNKSGSVEINSVIRKSPLENSDSEEDIGVIVKKTKYFINGDSD